MVMSELFDAVNKMGLRAHIEVHPYVLHVLMLDPWFVENFIRSPQEISDRFKMIGTVKGVDIFVRP